MFFHHDVQQVHNDLVKATASIDSRSKGERVNLPHDRARAEHITLDVNRLHGPDDVQGLDLRLELADMVGILLISSFTTNFASLRISIMT